MTLSYIKWNNCMSKTLVYRSNTWGAIFHIVSNVLFWMVLSFSQPVVSDVPQGSIPGPIIYLDLRSGVCQF